MALDAKKDARRVEQSACALPGLGSVQESGLCSERALVARGLKGEARRRWAKGGPRAACAGGGPHGWRPLVGLNRWRGRLGPLFGEVRVHAERERGAGERPRERGGRLLAGFLPAAALTGRARPRAGRKDRGRVWLAEARCAVGHQREQKERGAHSRALGAGCFRKALRALLRRAQGLPAWNRGAWRYSLAGSPSWRLPAQRAMSRMRSRWVASWRHDGRSAGSSTCRARQGRRRGERYGGMGGHMGPGELSQKVSAACPHDPA